MSHFTRIKTRMMVRSHIVTALTELGYKVEEGESLKIRGYTAKTAKAEIRVKTKSRYDIGFVRSRDESYSIVADWYGVRGVKQAAFKQAVNQRYATVAVKENWPTKASN